MEEKQKTLPLLTETPPSPPSSKRGDNEKPPASADSPDLSPSPKVTPPSNNCPDYEPPGWEPGDGTVISGRYLDEFHLGRDALNPYNGGTISVVEIDECGDFIFSLSEDSPLPLYLAYSKDIWTGPLLHERRGNEVINKYIIRGALTSLGEIRENRVDFEAIRHSFVRRVFRVHCDHPPENRNLMTTGNQGGYVYVFGLTEGDAIQYCEGTEETGAEKVDIVVDMASRRSNGSNVSVVLSSPFREEADEH